MEFSKEDLDKPFGVSSTAVDANADVKPEPSDDDEGNPVPYRRMKRYRDEAVELREREAQYRREIDELRSQRTPAREATEDIPSEWKELLGDSPQARKVYQTMNARFEAAGEQAEQRALDKIRAERDGEADAVQGNLEAIDDSLDSLSDIVGRDLTSAEQLSVLDIVDEWSPKDRRGMIENPISFEKAWELHELKTASSRGTRTRSRDSVASLSNSGSRGEPNSEDHDKSYNPQASGNWRSRI